MKYIDYLFVSVLAVLAPITPLMLVIGFLIMTDFIFGVWRAYVKKEGVTSRKMGNSIGKIFLYNMTIISVYFLDFYIIKSGLNLEKIAAGLIGITEFKSIAETFKTLTNIDLWDKLKNIVSRGESTTKDMIK